MRFFSGFLGVLTKVFEVFDGHANLGVWHRGKRWATGRRASIKSLGSVEGEGLRIHRLVAGEEAS